MTRVLRCGSLIAALLLGLACGSEPPTAPPTPPIATQPARPIPEPPRPPSLPSGEPVATYVFSGPLGYPVSPFTPGSRYLLYDNGVFGLHYYGSPYNEYVYLGKYQQDGDNFTFRFDGSWTWDQGVATAMLKGDLLEVRYSDIMQQSDFDNAVYRRAA